MEELNLTTEVIQLISSEIAWRYKIIPSGMNNKYFISEKSNSPHIIEDVKILFDDNVVLEFHDDSRVEQWLNKYYRRSDHDSVSSSNNVSNIRSNDFLLQLIQDAKQNNCSDIHIEIYESVCRVRLRIDGSLVERFVIPQDVYPSIINKLKIMANLDISEKRLPQDGRILFKSNDAKSIDIRMSVLPTLFGEKIVLRLLNHSSIDIDLFKIGLTEKALEDFLSSIKRSQGLILISGPTGSGKTTTLYATLKHLNKTTKNIITIEDPIEYTLEGINQSQLREGIGYTFGAALRTFLRQDPDIIMVGEIRDADTANMAIRLSLTGHLVLSTIHTNSAWGTISRLVDMGIPPYLLANTLVLSVAQRLVKKLCVHCREEVQFDKELIPKQFNPKLIPSFVYEPRGCGKCFYTGYSGRKAVYEVVPIDKNLAEFIKFGKFDVPDLLANENIKLLADGAWEILCSGESSFEEVYPLLLITS